MSNFEIIERLRQLNIADIASWALYDISDEDIELYSHTKKASQKAKIINKDSVVFPSRYQNDDVLANAINPNVMIIGLNAAERDIDTIDWSSFHDNSRYSKDRNIALDLYHTNFKGAYMTDLFKHLPVTDSGKINVSQLMGFLTIPYADFKQVLKITDSQTRNLMITARNNLKTLQDEIDILRPNVIIQYHSKVVTAFDFLVKNNLIKLPKDCHLITQKHYSTQGLSNQDHMDSLVAESKQIFS